MDQAENLRNIIKKQNQKDLSNARVIAVTSEKAVSVNRAFQLILRCSLPKWARRL